MICLTGDIHHMSLGTGNQRHCDITEVQVARQYLGLLREAGVKVTFFVSGRACAEEWSDLGPICSDPLVDLGGHNYTCFEPAIFHRVSKKLIGSYNGPAFYERWDVNRTIAIIQQRTGRRIRLWRNHMYMHGPWTDRVLASAGIQLCSDTVSATAGGPFWRAGVLQLPINIIPDHEHLYHADRTRAWVAAWVRRYRWSDDFGPESYEIDEWTDRVLDGLERNEAVGALSTLMIHPITMYLCDRFAGFRRILAYIASRQTVHASEVLDAELAMKD
jgi:hypothetical protein